jgi:hypothetical protein
MSLTAADMIAAASASGDCNSVCIFMRKEGVEIKVKTILKRMDIALRDVEGSEAERAGFRHKFSALRIWNGCSFVFFILSPHDIHNPVLIVYADANNTHSEQVSLDWDDAQMSSYYYYERVTADNVLRLHEFAVEHSAAAAACVHLTFRFTIEVLFNCASSATVKPRKQNSDGMPSRSEPGMYGYVAGYVSFVEPQMRWTEHIHMLLQLLGLSSPLDFLRDGEFVHTLCEKSAFIASIVFKSQEGFAAYLGTPSAMATSQQRPFVEVF